MERINGESHWCINVSQYIKAMFVLFYWHQQQPFTLTISIYKSSELIIHQLVARYSGLLHCFLFLINHSSLIHWLYVLKTPWWHVPSPFLSWCPTQHGAIAGFLWDLMDDDAMSSTKQIYHKHIHHGGQVRQYCIFYQCALVIFSKQFFCWHHLNRDHCLTSWKSSERWPQAWWYLYISAYLSHHWYQTPVKLYLDLCWLIYS